MGGIPGDSVPVSGPSPASASLLTSVNTRSWASCSFLWPHLPPSLQQHVLCPDSLSFWSPPCSAPHSCLFSTFLSLSAPASLELGT